MSTSRRYPAAVMLRARELRSPENGEWSLRDIARLVEREMGHRPAATTIALWCQSEAKSRARRHGNREQNAQRRAQQPPGTPRRSRHWKAARMHELREAGLSHWAISVVAIVLWGDETTEERVGRALGKPEVRRRGAVAGRARAAA